jgi:two-component system CheB/CheR fusion protein
MTPPARDERASMPVPSGGGGGANGEAVRRIGRLRVLVVDDNLDSARSMSLLLKLWGHESEVAPDGPAAIERAAALRPHVVLLDIGLPGMSGYDVARELRRRPESAGAMIVAVTGYGQSEDRQRSAAAGFDHHLVKPVDPSAVERLLDEARAASSPGAEAPAGARDGI